MRTDPLFFSTEPAPTEVSPQPLDKPAADAGQQATWIKQTLEVDPLCPPAPAAVTQRSFVVLWTADAAMLGRRFRLEKSLQLGRNDDSDIVLDDPTVSGRHCRIDATPRGILIRDLGSTNGTYVEDIPIKEATLSGGEHVRIGGAVLKYLAGDDLTSLLLDTVGELARLDPTGLLNRRAMRDEIGRGVHRAVKSGRHCTLLSLGLEQLQVLQECEGDGAVDEVLAEVARRLRMLLPASDVAGCDAGVGLLVLLRDKVSEEGARVGENIRNAVSKSEVLTGGRAVRVSLSSGLADTHEATSVPELIRLARARRKAAEHGAAGPGASSIPRRPSDAEWLFQKILSSRDPAGLAGYAIADARWSEVPEEIRMERLRTLFEHVTRSAGPRDLVAMSADAVLVGLFEQPDSSAGLSRNVSRSYWAHLRESGAPERFGVLSASLGPHEVRAMGSQSIRELEKRLEKSHAPAGEEGSSKLPFPLAVITDMIESQPEPAARVRALRRGLGHSVRFLSALHLAVVLRKLGGGLPASLLSALRACAQKGSAAAWEEALFELAQLTHEDPIVGGIAGALVHITQGAPRRSDLGQRLRDALVGRAREDSPADTIRDDPAPGEVFLQKTLTTLLRVCQPLSTTRLISLESVQGFDERAPNVVLYRVREHQGPKELFPIVPHRTTARLLRDWCYLLTESGPPLPLGPLVACRMCSCQRPEIFVAERLILGPPGSVVNARATASGHRAELLFPQDKHLEHLFDSLREMPSP